MVDEYVVALEGINVDTLTPEQCDALDLAEECMTFAQGLHNTFRANGARLPEELDLAALENLIDAHFCELVAATMLLSNIPDAETRLQQVAKELEESGADVAVAIIEGYRRLSERITKTKAVLNKFPEESAPEGVQKLLQVQEPSEEE